MPRVSVIMATYNCSDTLRKSIDSIIAQTYTDWEFIICDDCSTDNTPEILAEYAEKYPGKIIIIKNENNSKLAYSLNHCLKYAKGEYIARMDGDDISLPERFAKQVEFLDTHKEYSLVGVAMIPFDENGEYPPRYGVEIPGARDLLKRSPFFHATIMMTKEVYNKIGAYHVSKRTMRAQDYDMWFRFFEAGYKGYNMQEPLYKVLEDESAIKRRTFKSRTYEVATKFLGYRRLKYPWYLYICALHPIIAAMLPVGIMQKYHKYRDSKSQKGA